MTEDPPTRAEAAAEEAYDNTAGMTRCAHGCAVYFVGGPDGGAARLHYDTAHPEQENNR